MQLLACFWIALCLVVDTSTKSVTSTEDETGIGDLLIPLHGNADGNLTAEQCKCENGFCKENKKGEFECTCPPEWGLSSLESCRRKSFKSRICAFGFLASSVLIEESTFKNANSSWLDLCRT